MLEIFSIPLIASHFTNVNPIGFGLFVFILLVFLDYFPLLYKNKIANCFWLNEMIVLIAYWSWQRWLYLLNIPQTESARFESISWRVISTYKNKYFSFSCWTKYSSYLHQILQLRGVDTGVPGEEVYFLLHDEVLLQALLGLFQGFEHGGSNNQVQNYQQEDQQYCFPLHYGGDGVTVIPRVKDYGFGGKWQPWFGVVCGWFGI